MIDKALFWVLVAALAISLAADVLEPLQKQTFLQKLHKNNFLKWKLEKFGKFGKLIIVA